MDLQEYIKQMVQQELDEMSVSGDAGGYLTPNAFAKKGQGKNAATKYAEKMGFELAKKPTTSKVVDYKKIFEEELLNEVTYGKFKKDVKFRTKSEQLHKAIREVKRKLQEIDRIVEYTSRMKQELSEEGGVNYWKATQKNVATISEMVNQLNNKIKNLNQ